MTKKYFFHILFNVHYQAEQKFGWGIKEFDLQKPLQEQFDLEEEHGNITNFQITAFNEVT